MPKTTSPSAAKLQPRNPETGPSGYSTQPVSPPLAPLWTFQAQGKIAEVKAIEDRLLLRWGKTGWEMLDSTSGLSRISIADGPEHDDSTRTIMVPESCVVIMTNSSVKDWIWNMTTGKKLLLKKLNYKCFLGNSVILFDDDHLYRLNGTKAEILLSDDRKEMPQGGFDGDPVWYYCEEKEHGAPQFEMTAVDPVSGKTIWSRTFPGTLCSRSTHWPWVMVNCDRPPGTATHHAILDVLTGKTVWEFEHPGGTAGRTSIQSIYPAGIVLVSEYVNGQTRGYFFDFIRSKRLWALPKHISVPFCTDDVVWIREPAVKQGKSKPEHAWDLVARGLRTGKELWRENGLEQSFPFKGRLYSWRGRTLTCWAPINEVEKARARPAAAPKAAPKDDGVVLTPGRLKLKGPEDESEWRDESWYAAQPDNPRQFFPIASLLEGLREKFADVNLLPGGVVEIYDRKKQFRGRLTFDKRDLPKGTKKVTADLSVPAFRLEADSSVGEILRGLLAKRKLKWESFD